MLLFALIYQQFDVVVSVSLFTHEKVLQRTKKGNISPNVRANAHTYVQNDDKEPLDIRTDDLLGSSKKSEQSKMKQAQCIVNKTMKKK